MESFKYLTILSIFFSFVSLSSSNNNDYILALNQTQGGSSLEQINEAVPSSIGQGRIFGGEEASKNEFPSIINLSINLFTGGTGFCGGNIINSSWILTAAHCVSPSDNVRSITVTAGDHNRDRDDGTEQTRTVINIIVHPQHDSYTKANDLALLELNSQLLLNQFVKAVFLPKPSYTTSGSATVAGWGRNTTAGGGTNELRKANMTYISNDECAYRYQNVIGAKIINSMVCATGGGKGPCNGDSGGPIMATSPTVGLIVTGITSFGVQCGDLNTPNVFTRLSSYVNWIQSFVENVQIDNSIQEPTTTTTTQRNSGTVFSPKNSVKVLAISVVCMINFSI